MLGSAWECVEAMGNAWERLGTLGDAQERLGNAWERQETPGNAWKPASDLLCDVLLGHFPTGFPLQAPLD